MINQHSRSTPTMSTAQGTTKLKKSLPTGLTILLICLGGLGLPAYAENPGLLSQTTPGVRATPLDKSIIYVNPNVGVDQAGAGLTEAGPCRTITYALQQASPESTIILAPGSYTTQSGETFPLVLKPGITLTGNTENKGETVVIIGGGMISSSSFGRQDTTILAANDTKISGISVTNLNTRGTGLWIESTNPIVSDSTFKESFREGIFVTGTANPLVENNVLINNKANGISVVDRARGEFKGNLLRSTGFGIVVGGNAAPLVAENSFTENRNGLVVSDSARPVLRKNVFENNVEDGVVISAFSQAQPNLGTDQELGNNVFQGNGRYAIYNAARSNPVIAVGNQLDTSRVSGDVILRTNFADTQGNWAETYIQALAQRGILGGFPDGTFHPDAPVTRAQFAAIINKAFRPNPKSGSNASFSDVPPSFWAYKFVDTVAKSGFMSGYPGNIFLPDQAIPRVQVLVALANGLNLSTQDMSVLSIYQDAAQIPDYAKNGVAAATQKRIVVNYPTAQQLNPLQNATRAEVAAFVYQALVNAGKAEPIASPYIPVPSS
jgi:parallel beta-helix repeat protein